MANYTIEQWLQGHTDYDLTESAVKAILFDNGIEPGANVIDLNEMQRDLCLADVLMWLASSSTSSTGEYMSDGGWQHQKSSKNVTDRSGLRERARLLYQKWNSDKALTTGGQIVFNDLY